MTFWEEFGQQLMDIVQQIIDAILSIFGVNKDAE